MNPVVSMNRIRKHRLWSSKTALEARKIDSTKGFSSGPSREMRLISESLKLLDFKNRQVHGEEIEFRDVCFSYNSENSILKGINFHLDPGESVAIVGATGAGKTSIINLIGRFYDIQKGCILIDGLDIRHMKKAFLRRHIGLVLQDAFLFSGDIEHNIRLGEEGMPVQKVYEAARYANADTFIEKLPNGYKQELYERGSNLSLGQKQLISFARVLAFNPKILILDEATSSMDTETEILIRDAIKKLIKSRTTIIIAHRLSTIKYADKIIVMHKGEIAEMGRHEEHERHHGRALS